MWQCFDSAMSTGVSLKADTIRVCHLNDSPSRTTQLSQMEKYRPQYQLDNLKLLYSKYSSTPTPSSVILQSSNVIDRATQFEPDLVRINWQYCDAVQLKMVTFQKSYLLNDGKYQSIGLPEELPGDTLLEAFSETGDRRVILRSDSKNPKPSQYLVVYDRKQVIRTIAVKSLHDQISILGEPDFASFVLNDSGTILLCVVQLNDKVTSREANPASKDYDLDTHKYRQSWGEKVNLIEHSCIAVIHLEHEKLILIDKSGISLREPFFFCSEDSAALSIGCTGLQELPYKLGLAFCTNRISFLLSTRLTADLSDVSPVEPEIYYGQAGTLALSNPRVFYGQSNGYDSRVILLERDAGGAHNKSTRLIRFSFDSRKSEIIIDNRQRRDRVTESEHSAIGPLFVDKLPVNCFTTNGEYLLLHSDTPLNSKSFAVDLKRKELKLLDNFPMSHCKILNVTQNWAVAVGSSINYLPNVYLCNVFNCDNLTWIPIEDEAAKELTSIRFETFTFPSRDFPDKLVNCIWTRPVDDEVQIPTVLIPHGGPHSLFTTAYNQLVALFTELGLKTCLVNYVGSTGVDDEHVNALLGNIGTSDVHDVIDALKYVIEKKGADEDKVILYGGSHGGYLVTRISGQFAELNFLSCIARNPGIDVPSKTVTGDIPDWSMADALGATGLLPYSQMYVRTAEEAATMHRMSSMADIGNVKVPTLLLLGSADRRVPCSQGLLYHRILKARGVETRARLYADGHSLAKVSVEFDYFLAVARFIEKYVF